MYWLAALALLGLGLLRTILMVTSRRSGEANEGSFTTSDGACLHYLEAGAGDVLVMIPGWSQTAIQFKHQIAGLSSRYRVIALDMRGHGDSDKPEHGYEIRRLSADVHEFLVGKKLRDVTLAGHGMGCSVIWGYWELFGNDRLGKLILIDQMPAMTADPAWSDAQKTDAGALLDKDSLQSLTNTLATPDGVKTTEELITGMFNETYPKSELEWVIAQNLKMPRAYAARLLYDHATNDWRDVIPRIDIPTLVFGGKASLVGWKSQQWIGRQIPGARTEIFETEEGGNHFMFMENPEKFNRIVREFMG